MAKQPRSLYGKVAVVTGGGRGIGKALAARARERRLSRGDRRRRLGVRGGRCGRAGRRVDRARPRRHGPGGLHGVPRRGGAAARADRRAHQQRGHHARRAAGRGGRRDRDPVARDQPPRRHPRHEGGHAADEAARHGPHRQRRLERRQVRLPQPRHLLRHEARRGRTVRGRADRAARDRRRGLGADAGDRQDRAVDGSRRDAGVQELDDRGGRGRRRRRAQVRALRRLRAEVDRTDLGAVQPRAAARARGRRPRAQARPRAAGRRSRRPCRLRGARGGERAGHGGRDRRDGGRTRARLRP